MHAENTGARRATKRSDLKLTRENSNSLIGELSVELSERLSMHPSRVAGNTRRLEEHVRVSYVVVALVSKYGS